MTRLHIVISPFLLLLVTLSVTACGAEPVAGPPLATSAQPATSEKASVESPAVTPGDSNHNKEIAATPVPPEPTQIPTSEPPAPSAPTGTKVGHRIPDFTLMLLDGGTLTTENLRLNGKPAFLFFHADW